MNPTATSDLAEPPTSSSASKRQGALALAGIVGTGGFTMWLYAAVLNGYDRFYYGIGLNLSDLSFGFEEALAPFAQVTFTFGVLMGLAAACMWAGGVAFHSVQRMEHPMSTYVLVAAVIAVVGLDWSVTMTLAGLMIIGHVLGTLIAVVAQLLLLTKAALRKQVSKDDSERSRGRWVAVNMLMLGMLLVNLHVLASYSGLPGPAAALVLAITSVILQIAGMRWLRRHGVRIDVGSPSDAWKTLAEQVRSGLLGSSRRSFVTRTAALFVGLLLPVGAVEKWEQHMEEKGVEAAEYGYVLPSGFENLNPEGLRPITLARTDLEVDPLGLCQERVYAASLVEPVTDRQWILLRPVDEGEDRLVRVTPLPADAYTFQFATIPEPKQDGSPTAWTADACRDREIGRGSASIRRLDWRPCGVDRSGDSKGFTGSPQSVP